MKWIPTLIALLVGWFAAWFLASPHSMSWVGAFVVALFIYVSPALVAWYRRSQWRSLCYFSTIIFGWTVLGWLAGWYLAFHRRDDRSQHPVLWEVRKEQ